MNNICAILWFCMGPNLNMLLATESLFQHCLDSVTPIIKNTQWSRLEHLLLCIESTTVLLRRYCLDSDVSPRLASAKRVTSAPPSVFKQNASTAYLQGSAIDDANPTIRLLC